MAQTLEVLSHRANTLTSIRGIVHTMKTLSAINALPYEHAAQSIEAYHRTILEGFRAFLHRNGAIPLTSKTASKQVVVVFGSDHGLCGGYNETLAATVSNYMDTLGPEKPVAQVLCVGERMKDALVAQGVRPATTLLPPASVDGIGRLAGMLAARLVDIAHHSRPNEIAAQLAFTRRAADSLQEPVLRSLLPLDPEMLAGLGHQPWASRSLPDFTMPPMDLLTKLVNGHLFASMFRASAEALVTENAARLALMQQAEQSIEDRLAELTSEIRTVRQTEITTEILGVIAGFEALSKRRQKPAMTARDATGFRKGLRRPE